MTPTAAPQSLARPAEQPVTGNRVLLVAFAASLLLHLAGMFIMQRVPVDLTGAIAAPREQTVEIALAEDDPAAARAVAAAEKQEEKEKERERIFTSIPERLASDTPPPDDPSQPQYLAMYHSLAANPVMGGDAVQPSAPKAGEFAAVAVRREQLDGASGVSVQARPAVASPADAAQAQTPQQQAAAQEEAAARERAELAQERKRPGQLDDGNVGTFPLPKAGDEPGRDAARAEPAQRPAELADWWRGQAPSLFKPGGDQGEGDRGFDFDRDAEGMQTSGVARVGDYSLNTWEWNYAPWMQGFENRLMANWKAPEAFRLGLIWGKTVLKVVVEKDGTISAAEILETDGHESLHLASRAALVASSPLMPLPSHFPLAQLEIHLTMVYPKLSR